MKTKTTFKDIIKGIAKTVSHVLDTIAFIFAFVPMMICNCIAKALGLNDAAIKSLDDAIMLVTTIALAVTYVPYLIAFAASNITLSIIEIKSVERKIAAEI